MADRLKDEVDRTLESLFRSEPVSDDGFSAQVVSRVRQRMWIRRLALPVAFLVGAAISVKPLLQLFSTLPKLLEAVHGVELSLQQLPVTGLPNMSTIVWGLVLLASAAMAGKMLEE